jgi:hypothetical protein
LENDNSDEDAEQLLEQFLEICNMSMTANREKFPYCHIWRAAETEASAKQCEFVLVDDRPKALCQISLVDGTIKVVASDDKADATPVMKVRMSYIEKVVKSPGKYIEDPSLINWDWMRLVSK